MSTATTFIPQTDMGPMTAAEAQALAYLLPLSEDYPLIREWYVTKVVPGVRDGTRKVLRVERDEKLIGLGIAKNTPDEKKICTVRVSPEYFGRGVGVRIFDKLLGWLNVDQPHLTVSETKLPLFERIFDYYGFRVTSSSVGLYVPRRYEHSYNEMDARLTIANPGGQVLRAG